MAFNFNWSPLAADAGFYQRARDLLTTALNKSPKPPIIVDDIFVTEFNLGSVPPDLEILEIGDLAEDRFRGIFKMCYSGDAFLTLKTRVQVRLRSPSFFPLPSALSGFPYQPRFWLQQHLHTSTPPLSVDRRLVLESALAFWDLSWEPRTKWFLLEEVLAGYLVRPHVSHLHMEA